MKKDRPPAVSSSSVPSSTSSAPSAPPSPSKDTPLPPSQPSSVNLPNVRMAKPKEWKQQKFVVETSYFFLATQGDPSSPRYQRITSLQVEVNDNGHRRRFELRVDGHPAQFHEISLGDDLDRRET